METQQPRLRFPEFSGDWKLETFNKFFKIGSSKRVLQEDWKTEGIPFFRTRELVKLANNENVNNELFITHELYNELKNKYGIPLIGDILVSGVGTLGISYIITNSNPFYFKDGNVIWFKKIKNINTSYFNYIFQNSFVQNQIFNNASITTVGTFTIDNANKTKFYYSNIEVEQTKIANFLSAVDTKINQLTKKKNLLEQYKKGVMQKIFNQEIRFKDDNGNDFAEWEEKSFDDVLKSISTKKHQINSKNIKKAGKFRVIDQGKNLIAGYSDNTENVFFDFPVIIFGDHTTIIKYIDFDFIIGADGTKLLKNKHDDNLKYIFYNLSFNNVQQEGYKRHFSILSEVCLQLPCKEEQTKIASFLSSIDENINQVTKQLQQTTYYKKGLLQQMFV